MDKFVLELIIAAPPILFALTCHEFAHGFIAYRLGDPTAKNAGRLTLNPLVHLDLWGTLALFIVRIGWAKPVPVDPRYFRNPERDMLWVALAGPLTNLGLAVVSGILLKGLLLITTIVPHSTPTNVFVFLGSILQFSVWINIALCIFNLLPIPPLDGSRIIGVLLPNSWANIYMQVERYGFIILLILVFSGLLREGIIPVINFFSETLLLLLI